MEAYAAYHDAVDRYLIEAMRKRNELKAKNYYVLFSSVPEEPNVPQNKLSEENYKGAWCDMSQAVARTKTKDIYKKLRRRLSESKSRV